MKKRENKTKQKSVSYISDNDKLYMVQKQRVFNTKKWLIILILLAIILLPLAESLMVKSLNLSTQEVIVEYVESGEVDYNVYLKENSYYKEKFLKSGMEYVANLINTINPTFRYEFHATDNLDLSYSYKINGQLFISKDSESQPLYTQTFDFNKKEISNLNSNQLSITEQVVIDYDEYNSLVNRYKRDFGISVYSKLVVTMELNVIGKHSNNEDQILLSRSLQISIPLSEQTIKVSIDTDKITNNGLLFAKGEITIDNKVLFIASICAMVLVLILLITSIRIYIKFKRRNIYYITLGKYLNEYDKIIINGSFNNTNIDENVYDNVVRVEKFEELVDASENLSSPILFYEVIPGQLSFFVVTNDKTLYKFTLDKADLNRKETEKRKEKLAKKEEKKLQEVKIEEVKIEDKPDENIGSRISGVK